MTAPDPQTVAAAVAAWAWWPPEAEVVENDDFLLVRYPDHFHHPTQVLRARRGSDVAALIDRVVRHARTWERDEVVWWLPTGDTLEGPLRARGAALAETLSVLARSLTDGVPSLDTPQSVAVRPIRDADDLRVAETVENQVFGGSPAPDDPDAVATKLGRLHEEELAGTGLELLARIEGAPVGVGGAALADGVLRLWGGGVLEHARNRGVYRALLDARLRWGIRHGAELALVKGRVQTSGPILRRAGFASYGEQRSWMLRV